MDPDCGQLAATRRGLFHPDLRFVAHDEDFRRARGVIDVAATLRRQQEQQRASGQYVVLLPSGGRRTLSAPPELVPDDKIVADVSRWRSELPLTAEQLAFVALRALLTEDVQAGAPGPRKDGAASEGNVGVAGHE